MLLGGLSDSFTCGFETRGDVVIANNSAAHGAAQLYDACLGGIVLDGATVAMTTALSQVQRRVYSWFHLLG